MEQLDQEYPFNFGSYQFKISTKIEKAQIWWNRALAQQYGFNFEEIIYCCDKAIELDPYCGIIYALKSIGYGINYNNAPPQITPQQAKNQYETWKLAKQYQNNSNIELEKDIIDAIQYRVGDGITLTHDVFDKNYANELKKLYYKYIEQDISKESKSFLCALVAEGFMNLRPWNLWVQKDEKNYKQGDPYPNTLFIQEVLEKGLQILPSQPGIRHLWIHLMELSKTPEKALCSNFPKFLRDEIPSSGHLCHMPSHIEIQCGQYLEAMESNRLGLEADKQYYDYRKREKKLDINIYSLNYVHDIHFFVYAAMFAGQYEPAITHSEKILDICTKEQLLDKNCFVPTGADWLEGFIQVGIHVLIRFGKWEKLISETPLGEKLPVSAILKDKELYSSTLAMVYYGRGIAYAVLAGKEEGKKEEYIKLAQENQQLFLDQIPKVQKTRTLFNNTMSSIFEIAKYMLAGELLYRQEKYEEAFDNLKKAVEKDDNLLYDEPWGWMVPTRHALGALLLEQGILTNNKAQVEEAEQIYRKDLGENNTKACSHPDNVWSLLGLNLCLKFLGKSKELQELKPKLEARIQYTDLNINASCLCSVKKVLL